MKDTLRRMKEAFRAAGAPSFEARVAKLEALGKALSERQDALVGAIARDFGHRAKQETLLGDIFPVLSAIDYTKSHLRDWMEPSERETSWPFRPAESRVVHQPLGVVGVLSPWNYPLQLSLVPLVAAIAAGNRAMLKPSELVPLTSELLRELVREMFAEDEVAVITGGPEAGEAFASLPFDHLVFTGSTRVGKLVMRAASENLVPVTLELGGKSPVIVGRDFAASAAATRVITGKAFNAGQSCIAPDYALVPGAMRDAFVAACKAAAAKMYPSIAKNPDYTSIVSDGHFARLRAHVDDARARGAAVHELIPAGESPEGLREARKIAPTLILDVTPEMTCMGEELFGPLLPVVTYTDLSEAIAYVDDRPRPLALYYFGYREADVARVIAETTAGGVGINETMLQILQDDLPFGGVGPSGMGQYHGRYGFDALSKAKPVFRQSRFNATGLLRPPYRGLQNGLLRFLVGR
jgi:coniferyl-aldehyde dehydrogenase